MTSRDAAMQQSEPRYLFKIVPSTSPVREPLPERLPLSELDQRSGFIHLSTAKQVPNTLKRFFDDEQLVFVLRIKYITVVDYIRWETPDASVCGPRDEEGLFPHLYNGLKLGRDEVESHSVWTKHDNWDDVLKKAKPWLLY